MKVRNISGQQVGLRYAGQGAPALMLHCALGHSGSMAPLMAELSQNMSMTVFDLPGHGQSHFNPDRDIHDQTCDIAVRILQQQNRPSHLIGHSFGATVALRLAVEHPALVASICLYEPVYFSMLSLVNPAAYRGEEKDSADFVSAAVRNDWRDAARAFLTRWSSEDFDDLPAPQQAYILQTIPMILASNQSIIAPEKGQQIFRQLSSLDMPVLLMSGGNSPEVVHHIIAAIAGEIPHANTSLIAAAGHMGPITHAPDVARLVLGG